MRLTRKQLAKALDLSPEAIDQHATKGLPFKRGKGSTSVSTIDPYEASKWYAEHKMVKHAMKLADKYKAGTLDVIAAVKPDRALSKDDAKTFCKRVENFGHDLEERRRAYIAATGYTKAEEFERYSRGMDQYRKAAKDAADIDLRNGSMMSKDEVAAAWARIAQAIATDLDALPNSLAPRCEGKTAVEIAEIIRDGINDARRHTARSIDGLS